MGLLAASSRGGSGLIFLLVIGVVAYRFPRVTAEAL